jgi:hypothetical protein
LNRVAEQESRVGEALKTIAARRNALLVKTAKSHPGIADEPPPDVLSRDIAPPPTQNLKLRAWTAQPDKATQISSRSRSAGCCHERRKRAGRCHGLGIRGALSFDRANAG